MNSPRIRYQTIEVGTSDIHIRSLWDKQEFCDPLGEAEALGIPTAHWALFGILWASGEVLAAEMADYAIGDKRILELGCGLALASHLLNSRHADITATDMHPEAGSFLIENVRLNSGQPIPFLRADWKDDCKGLGLFDLIIGSDVLYERREIEILSAFIERHAKPRCEVILVDPGRPNKGPFTRSMKALGYEHEQRDYENNALVSGPFKGRVLYYRRS